MSANGNTAMDLAAAWTGASAGDAPDAASVAAGMGAVRGMNRSTATTTIATTSSPTTMRSSLRAVAAVIEALRSISCSRFKPSGVSSYTQEKMSAGTKPSTSPANSSLLLQAGRPSRPNSSSPTCSRTQAATRYSAATRKTLRRLSSPNTVNLWTLNFRVIVRHAE